MLERYVYSGGKKLRCGYTTGSCAAMAAKAAAQALLGGQPVEKVSLDTPAGVVVNADVLDIKMEEGACSCAIQKDAGDDADITDGMSIYARVELSGHEGVNIRGGKGVGTVTKAGLEQPVGEAAINSVPRRMIAEAVAGVCSEHNYSGGMTVTISVPGGIEAAARTFNPQLGIEGGISILGTTGIVEPMSITALLECVDVEIRQKAALGEESLLLTPGNYGRDFLSQYPGLKDIQPVSISNFIGDGLDMARQYSFKRVLLVGHIGKMVKLAGGIMNTHSRTADCRMEIICAHAAMHGASQQTALQLMEAATTDAALDILDGAGLLDKVLNTLIFAMDIHLKRRAADAYQIGAIVYSNVRGLLTATVDAEEIARAMEENG